MRAIAARIADGSWPAGHRLPSENQLRAHLDVSRTSVRDALAKLEAAGLISRAQGRGAFVEHSGGPSSWTLPSAPSLLGDQGSHGKSALTSTVIRAGVESLPSWAAATVGRESGGRGFVLERVRAVGLRTAVHVVNYMPERFSGILPELRDPHASLYATISRVVGVRIARMHRTIEAATADQALGPLLEVEIGHPVVVVEAVAYDTEGNPLDVSRASVRTDRLRVSVDTGYEALGLPNSSTSGSYPTPSTH